MELTTKNATDILMASLPLLPELSDRLNLRLGVTTKVPEELKKQALNLLKDFNELPDNKIETLYSFVGVERSLMYKKVTPNEVIEYYCGLVEIPRTLLFSKTRKREIVEKRQILQSFFVKHSASLSAQEKRYFKMTLSEIGRITGDFGHCTVIHSEKFCNNLIASNTPFRESYFMLTNNIKAKFNI